MLQNLNTHQFAPAAIAPAQTASTLTPPAAGTWGTQSPVIVPDQQIPLDAEDAAFDKSMGELRRHYSSLAAGKQLSFALKQRSVELPMVEYAVSFSRSSISRRQVVVRRLVENVEKGPGHLSVNRAKQALKEIACFVGSRQLTAELSASDEKLRWQAAHLLGWLKDSRTIDPLLDAFITGDTELKSAVDDILRRHFSNQFHWLAERRIKSTPSLSEILLPLTQ